LPGHFGLNGARDSCIEWESMRFLVSRTSWLQASRVSLMPEGLEEGLSNQDLADLVDFIFADLP